MGWAGGRTVGACDGHELLLVTARCLAPPPVVDRLFNCHMVDSLGVGLNIASCVVVTVSRCDTPLLPPHPNAAYTHTTPT